MDKLKKIAFAGTFDSITNGHLWVIKEGLELAQKVIVIIAQNPSKKHLFLAKERKSMIEKVMVEENIVDRVEVKILNNEYPAVFAKNNDCYLIRGMRSSNDYDYESLLQKTNVDLLPGAKTLFVIPPKELESVSSSYVKSLVGPVGWHNHIYNLLPRCVYKEWLKKYIENTAKEFLNSDFWKNENLEVLLNKVFDAYESKDRHYHNIEHLVHCIQELKWFLGNNEITVNTEELFLAILFHDIVYGARAEKSDEELSAIDFETFSKSISYDDDKTQFVVNLIMSTAHFSDKKIIHNYEVDLLKEIDLAILGQSMQVYNNYVKNVRKEYSYLNDTVFNTGRANVLKKFLADGNLFNILEHYNFSSIRNMNEELKGL